MRQAQRKAKDPIRVLVITPDTMMSELLRSAFAQKRRDFAVEALTGSSQKIIGELGPYKSDVALISEELQDGPLAGARVLQKLQSSHRTPSIMLLHSSKPERVVSAFREGARGVFYRTQSLKALSKCIEAVHRGQIWASNEDIEHLIHVLTHFKPLQFHNAGGVPLLTAREEEVVQLVADGLKNSEIADRLKIKEHSVRNYLSRIFDKLGVSTRVELVIYGSTPRARNSGNH